ncbi:hypothetical protein VII00023_08704, partial [Vibrio ichthyoenteri ATCC 700023]
MNLQKYLKSLNYNPSLSGQELSDNITQAAFNTSSLLSNIGQHSTDNPNYRNVYVSQFPSASRPTQGGNIPFSAVQSYTTTLSDFVKVTTRIELTNEVINISKFDIEANTASLVGQVLADQVAQVVVADIETRLTDTKITNPITAGYNEDILQVKSSFSGEWGRDINSVYDLLATAVKLIPDTYDANSKLFCNKNNFTDFAASITADGEQVWLIQNGLLLGRYEIVICDQLDDDTMYFGDLEAAFDVVSMSGNQTVDPVTKPDR